MFTFIIESLHHETWLKVKARNEKELQEKVGPFFTILKKV